MAFQIIPNRCQNSIYRFLGFRFSFWDQKKSKKLLKISLKSSHLPPAPGPRARIWRSSPAACADCSLGQFRPEMAQESWKFVIHLRFSQIHSGFAAKFPFRAIEVWCKLPRLRAHAVRALAAGGASHDADEGRDWHSHFPQVWSGNLDFEGRPI